MMTGTAVDTRWWDWGTPGLQCALVAAALLTVVRLPCQALGSDRQTGHLTSWQNISSGTAVCRALYLMLPHAELMPHTWDAA